MTDFLVLSQEIPLEKKRNNHEEKKAITWDEIVAKFSIHGIPPQQVANMTLKQIHYALLEWNEDVKLRIKLAGGEIPEDNDRELTLQDILGFGT